MAKNWSDPAEIARDSRVYAAFVLVLCGIAAWDVLKTIRFDISILTRRRPWRWPMALYFICRIAMLLHIFAMAVNLNAIKEIPCQRVTWISKVSDAIGTCLSSFILILRTHAVWDRKLKVAIPLGALFLGQVLIWTQTFRYSRARWNPQRGVCAVISTAPRPLLVSVFAYTMAFDLVILLLCSFKLSTASRSSTLAHLLLRDGIGYFCAAFGANLIQTIMAALALNPVMNIVALPFALVVSVIAATTVFRNVFVLYDGFSGDYTKQKASNTSSTRAGTDIRFVTTPRVKTSSVGATTHRFTSDIPLDELKNQNNASISIHRVVDVDVDGVL
ncbi:hypothetical protein BD779DRAFT_1442846 [Infundibulicybe gibba]|nr:hypothetical protein BD779DRAFT_1442846 [Infundibulicybe gibba]